MSNALIPTDAASAFRLAEMMCKGKLVPEHLRNSPGDCLMVIEQAMRWGMSPFAVAQCTSAPKGKLMFEGKLVAAAIQTSGILDGRLDYTFAGTGQDLTVTVTGKVHGAPGIKEIKLRLGDAATDNIHWKKQPEQQLVYAGTRVWGRRWTPEVMLGVYSPEEMEPERDTFVGTTIDARAEPGPVTRDELNAAVPLKEAPQERAHQLLSEVGAVETQEALDALSERVSKAVAYLPGIGMKELAEQLNDEYRRQLQRLRGEEAAA